MKERPIIMSAPMVRAILDGRKTQTRRVVKHPHPFEITEHDETGKPWPWFPDYVTGADWDGWMLCPYGQPGDRLWVREAWLPRAAGTAALYRADLCEVEAAGIAGMYSDTGRWRSPIHMPRWASRITLEVTGVRVERLQDISAFDALAEGVIDWATGPTSPKQDYRELWESINGPGSWYANPWVWVVEFKRAAQAQAKGE